MFQNILLAEYHGTFQDTPSNEIYLLVANLPNKFGWEREDLMIYVPADFYANVC
jgi:hypothetical protein